MVLFFFFLVCTVLVYEDLNTVQIPLNTDRQSRMGEGEIDREKQTDRRTGSLKDRLTDK